MERSNQVTPRTRRSRQQIEDLLSEFEKSKLTATDFCRLHNISTGNFHKWKSRYKSSRVYNNKSVGFATIDVVDSSSVLPRLFAEVNGIRIYQAVTASFLKELLV